MWGLGNIAAAVCTGRNKQQFCLMRESEQHECCIVFGFKLLSSFMSYCVWCKLSGRLRMMARARYCFIGMPWCQCLPLVGTVYSRFAIAAETESLTSATQYLHIHTQPSDARCCCC